MECILPFCHVKLLLYGKTILQYYTVYKPVHQSVALTMSSKIVSSWHLLPKLLPKLSNANTEQELLAIMFGVNCLHM